MSDDGIKGPRFAFDRSWDFDVAPTQLWALFCDTSSFTRWWPWLRSFDPVPLEVGAHTRCAIGPPLPYMLNVELDVVGAEPATRVDVVVTGDVQGPARLEIEPVVHGSRARLVWDLEVRRPMLRTAARVARPVLQWGHDWVVSNGVAQFRRAVTER